MQTNILYFLIIWFRLDRIKDKYIRENLTVTKITGKVRENRLRWEMF